MINLQEEVEAIHARFAEALYKQYERGWNEGIDEAVKLVEQARTIDLDPPLSDRIRALKGEKG